MPRNEFVCDCHPIDTELVVKTKSTMPNNSVVLDVAHFFSIVGDGTRCKILFALRENPMCVCDLANVLSMTKSSISHQLNKLKSAGFVRFEKQGKQVFYSLDDDHILHIIEISLKHLEHRGRGEGNEK